MLGGKKPGRAVQPPSARRDLSLHQAGTGRTPLAPHAGATAGGLRPGRAAEGEGAAPRARPAEPGTGHGDRPLRAGPAGAEAAERRQHPATGSGRRGAGTACEESRAGPASGTRPREVTAVGTGRAGAAGGPRAPRPRGGPAGRRRCVEPSAAVTALRCCGPSGHRVLSFVRSRQRAALRRLAGDTVGEGTLQGRAWGTVSAGPGSKEDL